MGTHDDGRDELVHDLTDRVLMLAPEGAQHGGRLIDHVEDLWQEQHAAELPYERLHEDYYTGMAEMVLRTANVMLDEIRSRASKADPEQARAVQRMKIKLGEEED